MMKRLILIFTIFCFSIIQTMALKCETSCSFERDNKQPRQIKHDCCHKGKEKKEDTNHRKCSGKMNGLCLHELVAGDVNHQEIVKAIEYIVPLYKVVLTSYDLALTVGCENEVKILNDSYLRHKSQVKIYLFQDQFLI